MPQPITHYYVAENAYQRMPALKELWKKYENYATLGSIFPDMFYFSGIPKMMFLTGKHYPYDYQKISDIIHWECILDLYFNMLDIIKKLPKGEKKDKLMAFAYGVASHYITDSNVHPFVYTKTGDHPFNHPDKNLTEHKSLESLIDLEILGHRGTTYFEFGYDEKIECHKKGTDRTLDSDIFKLIIEGMEKTYGSMDLSMHGIDYNQQFRAFEGLPSHPVLESYRDIISIYRHISQHPFLVKTYGFLGFLVPKRFEVLLPKTKIVATDLHKTDAQPPEPWIEYPADRRLPIPSLSVHQLIELSVLDTIAVMHESEGFLNSVYDSAHKYFEDNPSITPFLRSNINLDTGKFSKWNDTIRQKKTPADILTVGLGELINRYNQPR